MLTSTETEGRRSQIFYRMREFMGSREAILRVWLGAVGHGLLREKAAKFQSTCAKGSDTSATRAARLLPRRLAAPSWPACRSLAPFIRFLGEDRLETPTPGVFIFGQPGLEQTQKTKSVVHTQRRVTPRALVRLMPNRWEQISEAVEIHFLPS
jgi:hypothetical protein